MPEFFNLMAATVSVGKPVLGQTGCWIASGDPLYTHVTYSSGMRMSGVVLDNTSPAPRSLMVYSGGTASAVTLARGAANVYSGGLVSGISVTAPISTWVRQINVFAGGRASAVTLCGARSDLVLSSGGTASDITIASGGRLIVSSGGTALAVVSSAGAIVNVRAGGYIQYV